MNLEKKSATVIFLMTFLAFISGPLLLPKWPLFYLAPSLILLYYQRSRLTCLCAAAGLGLLVDLFSAHSHLGLHAINYCVVTAVLYEQRRHFFADSLSTLPLMTLFFAILSTLLQGGLLYLFEEQSLFSWSWVATDLLLMPALDALYAFALLFSFSAIPAKKF